MAGGNQDFMCECVPDRVLPGPLSGLGQSRRIYFTEAEAEAQEYRRLAQGHVIFMLRMCVCFHAGPLVSGYCHIRLYWQAAVKWLFGL